MMYGVAMVMRSVQKSIASRRRRETVLVFRANTQWNLIETDFFAPNQHEVCCVYWSLSAKSCRQ